MKSLIALGASILIFFCVTDAAGQSFSWPREDPERLGVDPVMVDDLVSRINAGEFGRQKSLLILRHGRLVHESYFNGFQADQTVPVYSVTKSWASALIGIAHRQKLVEGVDVPLQSLFDDYPEVFAASVPKQQLTLQDALTMRHGLAWDEWSTFFSSPANPVNQMVLSPDWWRFVLERPSTAPPDSVFRYSTGVSNLMGGVIWRLSGQTAEDYAQSHLFPVLDITDYHVEMNLDDDRRGQGISTFQQGLTPTGAGLWFRPRDMAKIGQLYLDQGVWQNRRILDRQWIQDSWGRYSDVTTDPQVFGDGLSYGYQWWNMHTDEISGTGPDVHFAWGYAEQFIFVVPELDLIVVSTADNGSWNGPSMIDAVRDTIIPNVAPGFDAAADGGLTGSWFSPQLGNQGFMLEVAPVSGQVVIYWMTYEPETNRQMWLLAAGKLLGRRAILQFLRPLDGDFGGEQTARLEEWGEVELIFTSCSSATLNFLSPVAGVSGNMELVRVAQNPNCIDTATQ